MKAGISTACLFPELTERALGTLLGLGCDRVEIFLNSPSECGDAYTNGLARMLLSAGAVCTALHPYSSESEGSSFFGRYPRRFDDGVEEYKRYFHQCGILGADIVVFHGARTFFPVAKETYFERFARLTAVAASFGVRLCHENVVRFFCADPAFVRELRAAVPEAGFVLDIKQAVRAGVDPLEMLDAMGPSVRHLHLSDHSEAGDCLLPGNGKFDILHMVDRLKLMQFDGNLILELYRRNFESPEQLLTSMKYIQNICA